MLSVEALEQRVLLTNFINLPITRSNDAAFPFTAFIATIDVNIPDESGVTGVSVTLGGGTVSVLEDTGGGAWFGEESFTSLADAKTGVNGTWTVEITGTTPSTSTFTLDATSVVDGDFFATPTLTNPTHGSSAVPSNTTFTWTDPTGASTSDSIQVVSQDDNETLLQRDDNLSGTLNVTDTSWTPPTPLAPGPNEFDVFYLEVVDGLLGDLTVTSGSITWSDSPFDPNGGGNPTPLLTFGSQTIVGFDVAAEAAFVSIEFSDFANPKRVGLDPFVLGQDYLIIGFDVRPDGTAIPSGTIINSTYESVGVRFSAVLTNGPSAGSPTDAQALDFTLAPNFGSQVAISPPNILSGFDPVGGPNASGFVAGTSILIVNFVGPSGEPGQSSMVGAFNDLLFSNNTLTAYSGPNATGVVLGSVSATGPGDFFGLKSTEGIGSITFSGHSTEVDNLVFSPVSVAGGNDTAGLFDPGSGKFFLKNSNSAGPGDVVFRYGPAGAGWTPVVGDWDNNPTDTAGLFDPVSSKFYLRNSNTAGAADLVFRYGPAGVGWTLVVGDWDGDGDDTIGACSTRRVASSS